MKDKAPLTILTLLITVVAIANLVRFIWNIPIFIGALLLPGWTGAIAYLACALLAAWSFKALYLLPSVSPLIFEKEQKSHPLSALQQKPHDYP